MPAFKNGDLVTLQGWSGATNRVINKLLADHGYLWLCVRCESTSCRIQSLATGYTRWMGYFALVKPEQGQNNAGR